MPDVPGQMPAGSAPPGGAPGASPAAGPSASPMMTPQKAAGNHASFKAKVMMAQKLMQVALADADLQSDDGKAVLEILAKLTKTFGKSEEDSQQIMPAELMQALQPAAGPGAAPQAGGKPPGGAPPPMPMQ